MSQLPAKTKFDEYEAVLRKRIDDIAALLPARIQGPERKVAAQRFIVACRLAAARNPSILQCTPVSILRAAFCAITLNLMPDVLGHGYFVPFGKELTWIIGYMGIVELAHRSGHISHIDARLVYEGEAFEIGYGTNAGIVHKPDIKGGPEPQDPADLSCESLGIVGAYAIAVFKDNAQKFEYMAAKELDGIRNKSRAKSGPWYNWPDVIEMYKKCPLRRLGKTIPQTPELHMALEMDNAAERGAPQFLDVPVSPLPAANGGDPKPEPAAEAKPDEPPPEEPPKEPDKVPVACCPTCNAELGIPDGEHGDLFSYWCPRCNKTVPRDRAVNHPDEDVLPK